jgi:hypothetical protein
MKVFACAVICWSAAAAAAPPTAKDLAETFTNRGSDFDAHVKFGFDARAAHPAPKTWRDADRDQMDLAELVAPTTIGASADGTAAWAGSIVRLGMQCAGLTGTLKQCPEESRVAALVVYEKDGKAWVPVAVHSAQPVADKDLPKLVAKGAVPEKFAKQVDAAAAEAAELFAKTIGDPKALGASVSPRKDALLFGSGPGEHAEGGAKVAATLTRWNLKLHVDGDSLAAGLAGRSVAWVAANVTTGAARYRVLAAYEKGAKGWQLVAIEFSVPNPDAAQSGGGGY